MSRKMAKVLAAGFSLCMLLTASFASAQISPEVYRLRSDDQIYLQVYQVPDINGGIPFTVLPDGRISLPYAGTLEAAGKTVAELEAELTEIYKVKLNLKEPKVSVVVARYRPIRASVSGQVLSPGMFQDFRPGDTVLMLLSRAGNVAINQRANMKRATLTRGGSNEVIPIDLESMLYRGDMSQNYTLEDGDTLFVPQTENPTINIQGAITRPGTYEYPAVGEYRLTDIVSIAQGPIKNVSKMSEILVFRRNPANPNNPIVFKANYVRLIKNRDFSQDILLKPNDLVYVTETRTPDVNLIGSALNTLFFVDRFLTGGFLGFKF